MLARVIALVPYCTLKENTDCNNGRIEADKRKENLTVPWFTWDMLPQEGK